MINGLQIILARNILGFSQEELADRIDGISLSTIGRLEKNRYEVYKKGIIGNLIILEKYFREKNIKFIDKNGEVGVVINREKGKKLEKAKK